MNDYMVISHLNNEEQSQSLVLLLINVFLGINHHF
jgi:hypothetical protein